MQTIRLNDKMDKIPTAEELYEKTFNGLNIEDNECLIPEIMIKFTKLHVAEALKHASENATITNDYGSGGELFDCIDKESILNAYNLNDIK